VAGGNLDRFAAGRLGQAALEIGIDVAVAGGPESQRATTERNLVSVGYNGYAHLYMAPDDAHFASAVDFKAPIRAEIERTAAAIIENMGDQPSDLLGDIPKRIICCPIRSTASRECLAQTAPGRHLASAKGDTRRRPPCCRSRSIRHATQHFPFDR
jgi:hypothetical protein